MLLEKLVQCTVLCMDVLEVPQSTFDARCLSVAYCWTALNEHECVGLHRLVYHREGQYRR